MRNNTEKIVLSGLFIAIGAVLPSLFHAAQIGHVVSPMHFPVLIAGVIIGWKYGLAIGTFTPIITSLMFGKPLMYPDALAMSLELAAYGAIIGLVYKYFKVFKNDIFNIFIALIIAMVIGRIVGGLFYAIQTSITGETYTFTLFIEAFVIISFPGIILQLLIVPSIISILNKNGFLKN